MDNNVKVLIDEKINEIAETLLDLVLLDFKTTELKLHDNGDGKICHSLEATEIDKPDKVIIIDRNLIKTAKNADELLELDSSLDEKGAEIRKIMMDNNMEPYKDCYIILTDEGDGVQINVEFSYKDND